MAWEKSPDEHAAALDAALPADPRVERRKMFGYPCAFVNSNMFAGLHQQSLIVRLPEGERARLLQEPGAEVFEAMPGRPMREYVAVPPGMIRDGPTLAAWVGRAFAYGAGLPPKAPGKSGSRKGKGPAA